MRLSPMPQPRSPRIAAEAGHVYSSSEAPLSMSTASVDMAPCVKTGCAIRPIASRSVRRASRCPTVHRKALPSKSWHPTSAIPNTATRRSSHCCEALRRTFRICRKQGECEKCGNTGNTRPILNAEPATKCDRTGKADELRKPAACRFAEGCPLHGLGTVTCPNGGKLP